MFDEISGYTKLMCLIAHPAAGSSSPKLHNASFEEQGLDARYMAFDVAPDQLENAVKGLKALGVCGWSVGVPHKKAIIPLLDEVSEAASLMKSVNCVQVLPDGRLMGHNTDGMGFVETLEDDGGVDVAGSRIVVIDDNAEGPSWIVEAALSGASEILVLCPAELFEEKQVWAKAISEQTNCDIRVGKLSDGFDVVEIPGCEAESQANALRDFDAICNGSRIGTGETEGISPLPASLLDSSVVVIDANYNPSETQLMSDAREAGCKVIGGLTPLLNQAAHAQWLWLERVMPKEAVARNVFGKECLEEICAYELSVHMPDNERMTEIVPGSGVRSTLETLDLAHLREYAAACDRYSDYGVSVDLVIVDPEQFGSNGPIKMCQFDTRKVFIDPDTIIRFDRETTCDNPAENRILEDELKRWPEFIEHPLMAIRDPENDNDKLVLVGKKLGMQNRVLRLTPFESDAYLCKGIVPEDDVPDFLQPENIMHLKRGIKAFEEGCVASHKLIEE